MAQGWLAGLYLSLLTVVGSVGVQVPACECVMNEQVEVNGWVRVSASGPTLHNYPTNYGETCGKHMEPGHLSCSYADRTEKPLAEQSGYPTSWCQNPWCYVDPCTCGQSDIDYSVSFPNAPLYFSYNNCGGINTFSTFPSGVTVSFTCPPGGNFASSMVNDVSCSMKLSNEATRYSCYSPLAELGQCVQVDSSSCILGGGTQASCTFSSYPANYGEGCGVHPEPGSASCSYPDGTALPLASQAQWCKDSWSYVNPCSCTASDMDRSWYFYPKLLFFSYTVCGSTSASWSTTWGVLTADSTAARCPSPAPPTATLQNPIPLPRSTPVNQTCRCQALDTTLVPRISCSTTYAQGGQCVNATSFGAHPGGGYYPVNYGATCGVHIEPLDPSCSDPLTKNPWTAPCRDGLTVGCRADWCDNPWCYVDPCACLTIAETVVKESVYFGPAAYFSYANCESTDTFSAPDSSFSRVGVCPTTTITTTTRTTTTRTTVTQPFQVVPFLVTDGAVSLKVQLPLLALVSMFSLHVHLFM